MIDSDYSRDYVAMTDDLRRLLDAIAASKPDPDMLVSLRRDIRSWTDMLEVAVVTEAEQPFGRQFKAPGRGQTMAPAIVIETEDRHSIVGKVSFGRYFLGGNGAAHGGAIAVLFDDILGRLATTDRSRARTAYLHIDYRAITPIDTMLDLHAWFVSEQGRKRIVRAELRNGATLCAEVEGLFLQLLPGQQ